MMIHTRVTKSPIAIIIWITLLFVSIEMYASIPVSRFDRNRLEQPQEVVKQPEREQPDKCSHGICNNKGRICEVICKNNPSEGGKFCNCDTYALRGPGPNMVDINRLYTESLANKLHGVAVAAETGIDTHSKSDSDFDSNSYFNYKPAPVPALHIYNLL